MISPPASTARERMVVIEVCGWHQDGILGKVDTSGFNMMT
jgi:hypothetical protein